MQAILLSAGRGQRLAPLTNTVPKPLIKVCSKALIDYQLEKLAAAGVNKVIINSGWLGQQVLEHVGTGRKYGLRIVYSIEPQIALETAGGIVQAMPLIDKEQFIVCNADVFHEYDFRHLSRVQLHRDKAHLILIKNPEHNPSGDFVLSGKRVQNKSANENDNLTYSGIGLYHRSFFLDIERGQQKLGGFLRLNAKKGMLSGEIYTGAWFDAGTQDRLQGIERYLKCS